MNFLHPIFLLLLSGAAVPLLIHIFSRRRVPEVPFSTLRFLRKSDRRSMRRVNIRRLILLLLRMAAIALVALAFARPVVKGSLAAMFPASAPRAVCILLDRSYSMGVWENEGTVFERGAARALDIMENLEEEDMVSVVLFDRGEEKIFESARFKTGPAREAVERVEVSYGTTDLEAALRRSAQFLMEARPAAKELYIISDFQRSSLGMTGYGRELPSSEPGRPPAIDEKIRVFLVPVQPEQGPNVSIQQVLTPRVVVHSGGTAELKVVLKNHSAVMPAVFPVRVILDGKRVIEKEVEIAAGGTLTENMLVPVERSGWIEGEVSKGGDRLQADDRRFFCIHSRERINVLLLADESSFYLEQALNPAGYDRDILVRKKEWNRRTTADMEWADLVLLGHGCDPEPREIVRMKDFCASGGRILALLVRGTERLVRGLSRYEPEISFEMGVGIEATVDMPGRKPDFLSPFDREDLEGLSRVTIIDPPDLRGVPDSAVLLTFGGGRPFVWRESHGEGTIMFAVFDPTPAGGDFILSPYFLPLVRQAVVAMSPERQTVEGVHVGSLVRLEGRPDREYSAVLPGGIRHVIESGWKGAGAAEADRRDGGAGQDLVFTAGEYPGFADVMDADSLVNRIAVNPDCALESDLSVMSAEEAADSLGIGRFMLIGDGEEVSAGIRSAREGKEISSQLVALAMILFLAELIVSQREEASA